jgi:alkylation response protein AidB-like acyl-CoA dehydrogenase
MAAIDQKAKPTDDVTEAWKRAKEGNLGALVDWAQYGIGYLGGNVVETVATSLLGAGIGAAACLALLHLLALLSALLKALWPRMPSRAWPRP